VAVTFRIIWRRAFTYCEASSLIGPVVVAGSQHNLGCRVIGELGDQFLRPTPRAPEP
jgi:hypothetical protein